MYFAILCFSNASISIDFEGSILFGIPQDINYDSYNLARLLCNLYYPHNKIRRTL